MTLRIKLVGNCETYSLTGEARCAITHGAHIFVKCAFLPVGQYGAHKHDHRLAGESGSGLCSKGDTKGVWEKQNPL